MLVAFDLFLFCRLFDTSSLYQVINCRHIFSPLVDVLTVLSTSSHAKICIVS